MRKLPVLLLTFATILAPASSFAQKWELGGGIGGSFFTSQTVKNVVTSGNASLSDALAASFWIGNNSSRMLGGEFRYDYENTSLNLSNTTAHAKFGADTHAFHYDFLFHLAPNESPVRPFVSAGGGVKLYRGTGQEAAYQPLASLALLTKTSELKPLLSFGAGLKIAVTPIIQIRVEVRDALTPFPKSVITPAQGSKLGGWLQDFMVSGGVSAVF